MAGAESKYILFQWTRRTADTWSQQETLPSAYLGILKAVCKLRDPTRALYSAPAHQQSYGSTVPGGNSPVGNHLDPKTARYLVPAPSCQFVSNPAGIKDPPRDTHSVPQEIMKYPFIYLVPAPPTMVRKQSSPPRDLVGDTPICTSRTSTDQSFIYGTWNSHGTQWLTLLGMVQRQSCLLRDPTSDQKAVLQETWQEPHTPSHLVRGHLTEDPTVHPEKEPWFRANLLNKVLEPVSSTQGPDRTHAHSSCW